MSTDLSVNRVPLGAATATPELLSPVGWAPEETRSSTSIIVDHAHGTLDVNDDGVVVMPLSRALVEYPWVQDLMFSLVSPDEDEVLRRAFESTREPLGTFTWVRPGATVELPSQSFCVMTVPQERQFIHDVTVIGEGAVVDMVSGAAVAPALTRGHHVSLSETFIGDGAQVRSVDVDRWGSDMDVTSYARTKIGENASASSVSVAVWPLRRCRSDSRTEVGAGSSCVNHSIILATGGSERVLDTAITLAGPEARAEQVSRMVSDGGTIRNHNVLQATSGDTRGFLECDGLMLRAGGRVESIPALDAGVARAQLSHEASVGMIDDEKMDYLMSTGLTESESRDLIVQGFLNLDDERIPSSIRKTVQGLVEAARGVENM